MKVFVFLSLFLTNLFFEVGNGCNTHYGEYGLFGDHGGDYMGHGHNHHFHMNVHSHGMHHHGGYGHGHGHHGMGMLDSLFRTDIGGHQNHHHHHSSHLIPLSSHRHRHVHRVHRRSVHSIRSRTIST
ncbi:unnamed protein product [Orchesella dallaii]|uniref:Histidine-rich glycoprotein n=1 Tax=Orchesella dallaii TaxID=48710 RepID=A0ABP1QER1_9HEXA